MSGQKKISAHSHENTVGGLPSKPFRTDIFDSNPWRLKMSTELEKRPGFGKLGKAATININSFPIEKFPNKTVYQYDVSVK